MEKMQPTTYLVGGGIHVGERPKLEVVVDPVEQGGEEEEQHAAGGAGDARWVGEAMRCVALLLVQEVCGEQKLEYLGKEGDLREGGGVVGRGGDAP